MNQKQIESTIEILKNKLEMLQSNTSLGSGAQDFIKLLKLADTDEDVAKRLSELGTASRSDFVAFGKEKGFNFTKADVDTVADEIFGASDELSNHDLEQVAGGTTVALAAIAAGASVVSAGVAVATLIGVTNN